MKQAFFAVIGLTLVPFGSVDENLAKKNPWRGQDSDGPVILSVRVEKVPLEPGVACSTWLKALSSSPTNVVPWDAALKGWQPLEPHELEYIQECDQFPCSLKLDETEVVKMSATPSARRKDVYFGLVRKRVEEYLSTGARREYELPGAPIDPWAFLEKRGFTTSLSRPVDPGLRVRKLEIAPREMKPIRQVLDLRHAQSDREGVIWVRDVYESHHLEGLGEWVRVDCGAPGSTDVQVTQAWLLELDQLKKRDALSLLGRSRIRSAVSEQAARYLDREFVRLSLQVQELKVPLIDSKPTPAPSAEPSRIAK